MHLRARLVACGWTYERLQVDSQPTGRAWCPRHDPIRYARTATIASPPIPFHPSDLSDLRRSL